MRQSLSRSTLVGASALFAAALVAASLVAAAPAGAATPSVLSAERTASVAAALSADLGSTSAGSYVDASGVLVVTVTDQASVARVRAAGAQPQLVARSGAQLAAVTDALGRTARIPGTAWAVDPTTDQVLVSVDPSVTGARLAQLTATLAAFGPAVRVEHLAQALTTRLSGGDAIYSGQYRCSLGFNVRSGSTYYFLTAGHCGNIGTTWYSDSSHLSVLGTRAGTSFPGNDYAIIRYTNGTTPPGTVGGQDITSSGTPAVNQTVTRRGSTTGTHSGRVTALNATVNYAEGTVTGLIRTTVCAEGGDSGGPLYSGTVAYGLTSGGSGNCSSGGTTFFQPVTEALSVYGVSVY